jgi:Uma2 family endonuclease
MQLLKVRPTPPTTLAAEGLPRRPWTLTDIRRMMAAGIIGEHERFELIGGEIVPMSPKGIQHETLKMNLNRFWAKQLPAGLNMLTETTLYVSETEFREPDFVFWPSSIPVKDLKPPVIQLLVEVADTSLLYDTTAKARAYAGFGIVEYWVIDAVRLVTHVHREPDAGGYRRIRQLGPKALLKPQQLPVLSLRLADLDLEPQRD